MMQCGNVVPETIGVSEEQFHAATLAGLARAELRAGRKALAFVMDLTIKQVKNIFAGGSPAAKRQWDALAIEPTVLDDIARLYNRRLVSADDAVLHDLATLPIAQLLSKVAAAESPESPGGTAKTHQELLAMEADIRAVNQLTANWIERIQVLRAPPSPG